MSSAYPQRHNPPIDHATTFPLERMTTEQRAIFREFLAARRKIRLNVQEPISFARLLVRHKPGVSLSPLKAPSSMDYEPDLTVTDLARAFDLNYVEEDHSVNVARTEWWLGLMGYPDEWSDSIARRSGIFHGYPRSDIEHYLYSDPDEDTPPSVYIEEGAFTPAQIAYTKFVPQRHADSIEDYERVIQTGREIWSLLSRYADRWELPELADYLRWIHRSTVKKFSASSLKYQWL